MKHTELQWSVYGTTYNKPDGTEGRDAHIQSPSPEFDICNLVKKDCFHEPVDYNEVLANADFIVKACNSHYDLLELLQECCNAFKTTVDKGSIPDYVAETIAGKVEQAIAKAKGETHDTASN